MTVSVRPALAADVPLLLTMLGELAAFEGGAVDATTDDFLRHGFGDNPRFEALIAERDGQPIGFVITLPTWSSWTGQPSVIVHDLYVRKSARGSGAGAALLREVARRALAAGCTRVDVNVLEWNAARAFYESLGFVCQPDWRLHRLDGLALKKLAMVP